MKYRVAFCPIDPAGIVDIPQGAHVLEVRRGVVGSPEHSIVVLIPIEVPA